MNVKYLLTFVAALIPLIPGLGALIKLQILPPVWNDSIALVNIAVSVLCFISVMFLYGFRAHFERMSARKAVLLSSLLFGMFLISMLAFSILKAHCVFSDPNPMTTEKVFIPIFVSEKVSDIIEHPEIASRLAWVNADGVINVNNTIREFEEGTFNIQFSMIIFILLYLCMFVFLISCILTYAFHLPQEPNQTATPKG